MGSNIDVNITVHQWPYWQDKGDYGLCYVDGHRLYFTESLKHQWGDDWDDAPYEHNAGRPYGLHGLDSDRPDVFPVVVATELQAPSKYLDRRVSVNEINKGELPWLIPPDWRDKTIELYAGDEYQEVISTIEEDGGTVYVPRKPQS